MRREGFRFLGRHRGALVRLGGWSLAEAGQTFLGGYCLAQALDRGFLAGRAGAGTAWLAVAALAVLAGGPVARGVFAQLAALVEPFRDGLVRRAVDQALRRATGEERGEATGRRQGASGSAVSRLTHQTEIARDSFAGLVLTVRSFVFTAVGALAGMLALAPELLLIALPPLLLGLALFAATLRPMAAAQRAFLDADEDFTERVRSAGEGLRDVAACGVRHEVAARAAEAAQHARRASYALARWTALRTLALGVAGQLPPLLLLLGTPWLLDRGLTAGALTGALAYLVQSLLPALHALMTALGAAGTRLLVVLDRFTETPGERSAPTTPPRTPRPHPTPTPDEPPAQDRPLPPTRTTPPGRSPAPQRPFTSDRATPLSRTPAPQGPSVPDGTTPPGRTPARKGSFTPDGATPPSRTAPPQRTFPRTPATPPCPAAPAPRRTPPAAELRAVTFAHGPGARPVLDGLDLVLADGEHLAVVGPSGIGKSTLTHVLAGLLPPTRGAVLLAGESPAGRSAAELARLRAVVPQQAYVFTASVRENLTHLHPDASAAEVAATVDALGLAPLLARLGGLRALLVPDRLSQGERQLLALARAHLAPAPLLLLDEATCHLDPAAEERAELALAARPGALVVVAHRMSSALRADRILVLDGTSARTGTHPELLASSPLYRDLTGHWGTGNGEDARDDGVPAVP
ncbi:ATP-binding cassette domain-containing protein [Streptomyces sp. NPDC004111]|uniref:ATP-binding cassette domain-containing protein n=1 Tax=Streptomyces sp. NPDC004111 TaxID=3364690 RepID=UPI0036869D0F